MPYIPTQDRNRYSHELGNLLALIAKEGISNGELNYLITQLARGYLAKHGTTYNTISDVIKAMECAKLEFYRRVAAPYEDQKIKENGDVYVACSI